MYSLRVVLAGLLVLGLVAVAPTVAQAAVPTSPYDAVTFNGTHGSSLVGASHQVVDDSTSTFLLDGVSGGPGAFGLYSSGGSNINIQFRPGSSPIVLGVPRPTVDGVWNPSQGDQFDLEFQNGVDCGSSGATGQITFWQYDLAPGTTAVVNLAASYIYQCADDAAPVTGELRAHSTIPYVAMSAAAVDFGSETLGQPSASKVVTITSSGPTPLDIGSPSIGGIAPAGFAITADTCANVSLTYGQQCEVSIRATGASPGPTGGVQYGALVLPDNSAPGSDQVEVTVTMAGDPNGTYHPIDPTRIMDTRTGPFRGALGPEGVKLLPVAGSGGVPATGASAVVLNVTIANATSYGLVTLYPDGVARPAASSLNFHAGPIPDMNSVTVQLGSNGAVDLYNQLGSTDVVVDVVGYYANSELLAPGAGSVYVPVSPGRAEDTRLDGGPLGPGEAITIAVDFDTEDPYVTAIAANVTAVDPAQVGVLTAWDGADDPPSTSTVDFLPHTVVPNMAIVPTSPCTADPSCAGIPSISIVNNSAGTVDVVVDVFGFYDSNTAVSGGMLFHPITPMRIADSRIGQGIAHTLGNGQTEVVTPGAPFRADAALGALALNVTAVAPSTATAISIFPTGLSEQPNASNLNPTAGTVVPNAVQTATGDLGQFAVSNANGNVDIVVDVDGYFDLT